MGSGTQSLPATVRGADAKVVRPFGRMPLGTPARIGRDPLVREMRAYPPPLFSSDPDHMIIWPQVLGPTAVNPCRVVPRPLVPR